MNKATDFVAGVLCFHRVHSRVGRYGIVVSAINPRLVTVGFNECYVTLFDIETSSMMTYFSGDLTVVATL